MCPGTYEIGYGNGGPAAQWDQRLASPVWGLPPPSFISDLRIRAGSTSLNGRQRSDALTALSFVNTKAAVLSMIELTKSRLKDVAEKATYWVSFRQSNDWFSLVDWSKTGIDTEHERQVSSIKLRKNKLLDEVLPFDEKKS